MQSHATPKSASTHSVSRPTSSQATAAQTPTFLSLNPVEQCFLPAVNDDKLRQDIARILQDELRLALAETNSEVEHARFEDARLQDILNSPENREAYQGAQDLVQFALTTKRWTENDAQALRAALTHLTQEQAAEVFEQLIPAINRGELVVETNSPPF